MATEPSLERVEDRQRALLGGPHDDDTVLEVLARFKTGSTVALIFGFRAPSFGSSQAASVPRIRRDCVESESVAALSRSGLPMATIYELYAERGHARWTRRST